MVQPLTGTELIQKGMSLALFRQQLLASNIANVDTPGYKRFDLALRKALESDRPKEQLVYQEKKSSLRVDGNNVDIEQEMAKIAENSLYFSTLSSSMTNQWATMRHLISEGRR